MCRLGIVWWISIWYLPTVCVIDGHVHPVVQRNFLAMGLSGSPCRERARNIGVIFRNFGPTRFENCERDLSLVGNSAGAYPKSMGPKKGFSHFWRCYMMISYLTASSPCEHVLSLTRSWALHIVFRQFSQSQFGETQKQTFLPKTKDMFQPKDISAKGLYGQMDQSNKTKFTPNGWLIETK